MAEPFHGTDLYDVDSMLEEDERLVRDNVARWVDERFLPIVTEHYRKGTFPIELSKELGEMGLLGTSLTGYGCPGLSGTIYGLAMQELERGDSGLRSFASVQGSLAMFPIWKYGSEMLKERYLPKMAAGELIGCFGLTEPDHGSDPGGMVTRAKKDGDHYVLSGEKLWITNGSVSDLAIVWAKVDGDEPKDVRGFVVEKGLNGFTSYDVEGKFSLRASVTSGLVMDEVRVPADHMLEGVAGMRGPLSCLNQARYGIAWGAVGSAIATYKCALDYSRERIQFGRPIAGFQLVQAKLAEMISEIIKAPTRSKACCSMAAYRRISSCRPAPGSTSAPLRTDVIAAAAPVIQDLIVCGHDRDEVGVLAWPALAGCRDLAGATEAADIAALIQDPKVRAHLMQSLAAFNRQAGGSSRRVKRVMLMEEPPQIDANEVTDKGYINQRATLARRAHLVQQLFADPPSDHVMVVG